MTNQQPPHDTYFKQNQAYIAIGHEVIRLLQSDTIGLADLLKEMTEFYMYNDYNSIIPQKGAGVTKRLLQNCVPGLANKSDFKSQILWKNLKRHLYRMPQPLLDLYQAGFIDNGFWCDNASNTSPHIWEEAGRVAELVSLPYDELKVRITALKNGNTTGATAHIPKPATLDDPEKIKEITEEKNIKLFPDQEEARYSLRETRPNQRRFAEQVEQRYGILQCAVCDITHRTLLQAAHIIPKSANGSDEPENGLMLCATHHLAFDNGLLRINPESLEITSTIFIHATYASIAHLSQRPSIEALQYHDEHACKREID